MSKIKKLIKAFGRILNEPALLNLILNDNDVRKANHLSKYPDLTALPQVNMKEISGQNELNMDVEMCFLDGASMPTDLALLKLLAKGKSSYFEIGTWRGESVRNVAEVIEDCTTLNLSSEEMKKMGWNPKYAELHGIVSKNNSRILHLEGNSLNFDFQKLNKKYDLIFIDGDHTYEFVKNDTEKVFQNLVHKDTVVVWHDYAYSPEKIRYEVFSAILDGLPKEHHKNLYHIKNTMCAVFTQGNFKTSVFENLQTPESIFRVHIKNQLI